MKREMETKRKREVGRERKREPSVVGIGKFVWAVWNAHKTFFLWRPLLLRSIWKAFWIINEQIDKVYHRRKEGRKKAGVCRSVGRSVCHLETENREAIIFANPPKLSHRCCISRTRGGTSLGSGSKARVLCQAQGRYGSGYFKLRTWKYWSNLFCLETGLTFKK